MLPLFKFLLMTNFVSFLLNRTLSSCMWSCCIKSRTSGSLKRSRNSRRHSASCDGCCSGCSWCSGCRYRFFTDGEDRISAADVMPKSTCVICIYGIIQVVPKSLLFCAYHPCQPTLLHTIPHNFLNLGSQGPSAASQLMFLVLSWRWLNRCTLLPRWHPRGPNITYRHHCQLCTTSRCPSRPGLWARWAIPRPVSHILKWIVVFVSKSMSQKKGVKSSDL